MIEYKLTKFFGAGAVIFIATAFFTKPDDNKLMIAGLIFAGLALLAANIGNVRKKREAMKTKLKTPKG